MPSSEEEVWRYSRVADVDLSQWAIVSDRSEGVPAEAAALLGSLGHLAGTVVVRNGAVVASRLDEALSAKGVYVGSLVDGPDAQNSLGVVADGGPDVFGRLNDANFLDGVLVHVPAGVTVDAPIAIIDWIDIDGSAVYPRLVVRVGADADVRRTLVLRKRANAWAACVADRFTGQSRSQRRNVDFIACRPWLRLWPHAHRLRAHWPRCNGQPQRRVLRYWFANT
jgi:Fe-S cluster assembly protein SufD